MRKGQAGASGVGVSFATPPCDETQVTEAMIEAGIATLRGWISEEARSVTFDREIVIQIFERMQSVARLGR